MAFEEIPAKLKEFGKNNKVAALRSGAPVSAADLSRATKDAPAYQEAMRMFSKHITLCAVLRNIINAKKVRELGMLEQVCALRCCLLVGGLDAIESDL